MSASMTFLDKVARIADALANVTKDTRRDDPQWGIIGDAATEAVLAKGSRKTLSSERQGVIAVLLRQSAGTFDDTVFHVAAATGLCVKYNEKERHFEGRADWLGIVTVVFEPAPGFTSLHHAMHDKAKLNRCLFPETMFMSFLWKPWAGEPYMIIPDKAYGVFAFSPTPSNVEQHEVKEEEDEDGDIDIGDTGAALAPADDVRDIERQEHQLKNLLAQRLKTVSDAMDVPSSYWSTIQAAIETACLEKEARKPLCREYPHPSSTMLTFAEYKKALSCVAQVLGVRNYDEFDQTLSRAAAATILNTHLR